MRQETTASGLTVGDFERVFKVLERVESARSVGEFRELTLEAVAAHLGYHDTTFFLGSTYTGLFDDPAPLANGRTVPLLHEYRSGWRRYDVFTLPESLSLLSRTHAASVHELRVLPSQSRDYLDKWLARRDLPSVNAIYLRPGGAHALVGVFGRDGLVSAKDLAVMRLLGQRLSAVSRHLPHDAEAENADVLSSLSPRLREVATLVCDGLTNAVIGRVLTLTEGTVKKYVSQILAETGCRSRTELVLCLRPRRP